LEGSPHRGPAHHGPEETGPVHMLCRAYAGGGTAPADRRARGALFLQPPNRGMADEPLGMRPGEDDGTDARIAVDPGYQPVQLTGDIEAEHLVRAAVDPDDQDGPAIFDLQTALV